MRTGRPVATGVDPEVRSEKEMPGVFPAILNALDAAVIVIDQQWRIVFGNAYVADKLLGIPYQQISGFQLGSLKTVPDEELQRVINHMERVLRDQLPDQIENWALHQDGRRARMLWSSRPLVHGDGEVLLVGIGLDVTELRRTEAALRESEARLRGVLRAAPDPIIVLDPDHRISYANDATERVFGYVMEELRGLPLHHVLRDADGSLDPSGQCSVQPLPAVGRRKDGATIAAEVTLGSLGGVDSPSTICSVRDVTEQERAAKQIRDLNAALQQHINELTLVNREIEAFNYSVSHDLRGPLHRIGMYAHILMEDHALPPEPQRHLQVILDATEQMAEIMDGLLRLSRVTIASIRPQDCNVSEMAHEIAAMQQQTAPHRRFVFHISPDIVVKADRALLRIVLENLLGNACKFTGRRDLAEISLGEFSDPERGQVVFVQDNGDGFDMADTDRLFQAFERLHGDHEFSGTGIGLATVARIIRRHGGNIWARSTKGEGATFFFRLTDSAT